MDVPHSSLLMIDVLSYWLHATGRGGGADFDLVADRDDDGFPVLRGRHVRGLLREAARQGEAFGYDDAPNTNVYFGGRGENARPGCLIVGDARMSRQVAEDFATNPEVTAGLFRNVASTAIDAECGAAKPKSLRTIEVACPCTLYAKLEWAPQARLTVASDGVEEAGENWPARLETVLPLIDGVGAKRSRGMGRARFALVEAVST